MSRTCIMIIWNTHDTPPHVQVCSHFHPVVGCKVEKWSGELNMLTSGVSCPHQHVHVHHFHLASNFLTRIWTSLNQLQGGYLQCCRYPTKGGYQGFWTS